MYTTEVKKCLKFSVYRQQKDNLVNAGCRYNIWLLARIRL